MSSVLLASRNRKKLAELRSLLEPAGIELLAQGDLAIPEADEPFDTFIENALAKARHAARASGMPALADDSGLCVDALQGLPGVRSSRFALDHRAGAGDMANNALLLDRLASIDERGAAFVCVLVALRHVAKAHGMAEVARRAEVGEKSLFKSLSDTGNPTLETISKVLHAVGLRLSVTPAHA